MRISTLLLLLTFSGYATAVAAQEILVPEAPQAKVEEIERFVERMPMFISPSCDTATMSDMEMQMCAQRAMLQYIYGNITYPLAARRDSVEGTAVITFIVEKDGSIFNAQIARDPGAGTGEEALRVVNTFEPWIPGMSRGEPVRVQFNLPVKFKLD